MLEAVKDPSRARLLLRSAAEDEDGLLFPNPRPSAQHGAPLNKKRTIILNTAVIFGFFAIFIRLTFLMVIDHRLLSEKAKSQQVKAENIQVRRGNIYDRRGREFAVNMELESLYCDAREVSIDKDRINRLSSVLG